jgi:hypothetical protein
MTTSMKERVLHSKKKTLIYVTVLTKSQEAIIMIRALGFSRGVLASSFKAVAIPRKGMAVLAAVSAVKNLEVQAVASPHSDALKMVTDGAKPVKYSCPPLSLQNEHIYRLISLL